MDSQKLSETPDQAKLDAVAKGNAEYLNVRLPKQSRELKKRYSLEKSDEPLVMQQKGSRSGDVANKLGFEPFTGTKDFSNGVVVEEWVTQQTGMMSEASDHATIAHLLVSHPRLLIPFA